MARETRAVWAQRVARWQRSRLPAARFAAREGVNPRTLTFWKWKLSRAAGGADGGAPARAGTEAGVAFVEMLRAAVPAAAGAPALEVVLPGGAHVRVGPGFDPATLRALLAVLEAPR
jgi:hypothetical protein